MRSSSGPNWPTHRRKRHLPPRRPEPEQIGAGPTTGQMAADLVRRGLRSPLILDPRPTPRGGRREGTQT